MTEAQENRRAWIAAESSVADRLVISDKTGSDLDLLKASSDIRPQLASLYSAPVSFAFGSIIARPQATLIRLNAAALHSTRL